MFITLGCFQSPFKDVSITRAAIPSGTCRCNSSFTDEGTGAQGADSFGIPAVGRRTCKRQTYYVMTPDLSIPGSVFSPPHQASSCKCLLTHHSGSNQSRMRKGLACSSSFLSKAGVWTLRLIDWGSLPVPPIPGSLCCPLALCCSSELTSRRRCAWSRGTAQ